MSGDRYDDDGEDRYPQGPSVDRSWLVDAIMDDLIFDDLMEEMGPVALRQALKNLLDDFGQQEARKTAQLSDKRDHISYGDYGHLKKEFHQWRRSMTFIRSRAQYRLETVNPVAQGIIDSYRKDRQTLVIMAKRIWLWQEGLEDKLEDVLDDFTISEPSGSEARITLRELVETIQQGSGEITP